MNGRDDEDDAGSGLELNFNDTDPTAGASDIGGRAGDDDDGGDDPGGGDSGMGKDRTGR